MNSDTDLADLNSKHPDWFVDAMSEPREEGFVEVQGCAIHYFCWGDVTKPGLVLVHGRMSHARCWAFIAPLLAQNYHCVAFDLSGMGESGTREYYSYDHRAAEVLAVTEKVGMFASGRKPHLVCHSYGCLVGIAAAERYPSRWAGIITCDMLLLRPDETERLEPRTDGLLDDPRPHKIYDDVARPVSRFRLAPEQSCNNSYLLEYLARHSLKQVPGGWVWKFDPAVYSIQEEGHNDWWVELTPQFIRLPLPKAIIFGKQSLFGNAQSARYAADASKNPVPVVGISDAQHHIMLDQPIALVTAIEALLGGFFTS